VLHSFTHYKDIEIYYKITHMNSIKQRPTYQLSEKEKICWVLSGEISGNTAMKKIINMSSTKQT